MSIYGKEGVLSRYPQAKCVMTSHEVERKKRHEERIAKDGPVHSRDEFVCRYWIVKDMATGQILGSEGTTATAWSTAAKRIRNHDRYEEQRRLDRLWLDRMLAKWDKTHPNRQTLLDALAFM